jgi:excisionase family DNA binding protein
MPPETTVPQLHSASEVARLLGVHRATVHQWKEEGKLPAVRVTDRTIRFRESDVLALIGSGAEVAP